MKQIQSALFLVSLCLLVLPSSAFCEESDWSVGAYVGQYYDTEPAGWSQGKANYLDQYLVALTASKTLWRSQSLRCPWKLTACWASNPESHR